MEFPELVDWTTWLDDGIKYYSGKATYLKSFDLSLQGQGSNSPRIYLNLGELKNVAEVRLNGKNLGVLWTRPFRVELTGAVKSGKNDLEIDIVNLWPNRLVGDDLLPPERRFTKTNVRKFTKDFPLYPSGLLGPVTLELAMMPER
ncbi:MAG: glycosylhydrolase-like jelly roll fold domain-containing protein [Terriglobia bacterium]